MTDLVVNISDQTDEELRERLRLIRHRRSVERPAAKARAEKAEVKETRKKMSAIDKLVAGLSDEERAALLTMIGEGE